MFLLMLTQSSWDILSTYIKYNEGFYLLPDLNVVSKPFFMWSKKNQDPMAVMNYVQAVTFSLQVSILLLLQCFWNYISNTVAKRTFMSSREFSFYIIWTICSVAMFPILQWRYRDDHDYQEVVPQMAYSCELLVVTAIGFMNEFRFKKLIKSSLAGKRKDITEKLTYFRDMNLLLTISLLVFGSSMFILCADGFTEAKVINKNKFGADLLICNVNISCIFLWLVLINIFHPSRPAIEPATQTTGISSNQGFSNNTPGKNGNSVPLAPLSSPTNAYTNTNKNNAYFMKSIESDSYNETKNNNISNIAGINKDSDSGYGYSTSPPKTVYQQQQQQRQQNPRDQVISITDPYMKEPVTFSMVKPSTISYASGLDYYGINKQTPSPVPSTPSPYYSNAPNHSMPSSSSPPPPLPSSPPPFLPSEQQYSQYDPNYEAPSSPPVKSSSAVRHDDNWLRKPTTSPSRNNSGPLHY
ncbi:hypothetical protein BJ944DRAFT_272429, partial [Cunninghamella echinulata]